MGVRLDELRVRVRQRADMVSSSFVTTDELNDYINEEGAELHGVIVTRYEDYLTSPSATQFTLTGSASTYALPSGVMKLRGVDYSLGGEWHPIRTFNWEERGKWNRTGGVSNRWNGEVDRRYRQMGQYLTMVPEANCAGTYRYWHVPRWTDLTNDSDELSDSFNGWSELIVVGAAIKCLQKEESDATSLMVQKKALLERIEREASNRDASEQEFIGDVTWRDDTW